MAVLRETKQRIVDRVVVILAIAVDKVRERVIDDSVATAPPRAITDSKKEDDEED